MLSSTAPPNWLDTDLVMISALQHWSYCPRQCGLIHLDQVWGENLYTLRGSAVHETVDEPGSAVEDGVRVERGLPLWSDRLGLIGKGDVVEFHEGAPYPVEYKHGPRKQREADDLQLAAQALCLEEMFGVPVPRGALFHHSSRRRREISIGSSLRAAVEQAVEDIRAMIRSGTLPPAVNDKRCDKCSLRESCLPTATQAATRSRKIANLLFVLSDVSERCSQ